MKRLYPIVVISILMFSALPVHAQDGCIDSPENPTAILGLVGVAGLGLAQLRNRMKK